MPNAMVMTGYGPPEVLKWTGVPLTEPGEGQIRIKVKAAGASPHGRTPPIITTGKATPMTSPAQEPRGRNAGDHRASPAAREGPGHPQVRLPR